MKSNNKGFIATALLYSLLVVFLFLIVGLLAMLQNRRMILDKLKDDIKEQINGMSEYNTYEDGTVIYYNPSTDKLCTDYVEENSATGIKSGCMKWYIYGDNKNKATVNMILDHNTTNNIVWNSTGDNSTGISEAKSRLEVDTKGWETSVRLISADEIANIVGADKLETIKWKASKQFGTNDIETKVSWFYLDGSGLNYSSSSGWQKKVSNEKGMSKYSWLFDYTNNCESSGCNINDSSANEGYWTSTGVNEYVSSAWYVHNNGSLDYGDVNSNNIGIRPVIIVSKKDLTKTFNITYDYTGNKQNFIVPVPGNYKIELWGASGATSSNIIKPGNGAYTSGIINLKKGRLYIYVGSNIKLNSNYTFNGGGAGEANGGGSTDIRLVDGNWDDFDSLKSRIMVAAGGGGGFYKNNTSNHKPGSGGGLTGYNADADYTNESQSPLLEKGYSGHGGTQLSFVTSQTTNIDQSYLDAGYHVVNANFGYGGYGIDDTNRLYSSGGGSGYFGGGHGIHPGSTWSGGGGGSSFISGHNGCIAITEASRADDIVPRKDSKGYPCNTGTTDIMCSYHYSDYKFNNTVMIDGEGCKWTKQKTLDCSGMPTHGGNSTMMGNSGNGYAKITYLGE